MNNCSAPSLYQDYQYGTINVGSPFEKVAQPSQAPYVQNTNSQLNYYAAENQKLINQNKSLKEQQLQAAKNTSQLVDDNIRLNKENQNLNNTILQLKAMRECKEYVFYSDESGLNYCLEGNYKKICIGYLDIINISEIYIYKGK